MPPSAARPAESFVRRVRALLDELSSTERRLADFLLEFPGELASYAASELASLAGVSNATVSRFIRRLGYASYDEARRHVREEKESGSPLFQAASSSRHGKGSGKSVVALHLEVSQANLVQTFGSLSDRQLDEIVKALIAAPQVLVFGSRSSHGFATYLRWQLMRVLSRVVAVPGPGETLAEHAADLSRQDCVIVFGMRRQTRQMDAMLQAASRARSQILFISDRTSADFAGATWSVQCQCTGAGALDNHVAVMALCDLIATMVIEAAGPAARKRLAAIELAHEELDEL